MRTIFTVVMATVGSNFALSQIGINTANPITSLDVVAKNSDGSTAEGILPPRLTGDQLRAGDFRYSSAHAGTIVYVTSPVTSITSKTNRVDSQGLYYFDGTIWQKLMLGDEKTLNSKNIGDIKTSVKKTDHAGWYLLDGRSISVLSTASQTAAASLGFTDNLPDSRDRVLKSRANGEVLGTTGGENHFGILQSNLPNITLSGPVNGVAQSAGSHTHSSTEGGFLLGGTTVNNSSGGYVPDGGSTAWGGIGMLNNTAPAGAHMHTVAGTATISTGGGGKSIDNRSAYLVVNTFIYLGE
jgi:hypothetical protein